MKLKTTVLMFTLLFATCAQAQDSLHVLTWGGSYEEAQHKAFFNDFEKEYNTEINTTPIGDSILGKIRAEAESNSDNKVDVVDISAGARVIGCETGLLVHIEDLFDPNDYIEGAIQPCGIANSVWSLGVVSRPSQTKINSAEDFFNPDIPGNRALKKHPRTTLELALLGAGVPKDEIYDRLRTEEGVQLAFDTMDKIKDRIKWWSFSSQASNLLMSDNVVATTVYTPRIVYLQEEEGAEDVKIHWNSHVRGMGYFSIPKASDNKELAIKLVKYATGPKNNDLVKFTGHSPIRSDQPELSKDYATHPENAKQAIVQSDEFWGNNEDRLVERFQNWLAQ